MGLLTNPSQADRLPKFFVSHQNKLCLVSYFAGILCFLLLAHKPFNAGTYFSENALLPGLIYTQFTDDQDTRAFYQDLKHEADHHPSNAPYAWLLAKFKQMGLDTYEQDFHISYPLASKANFSGKNIYAILRAPRIASTEALVLSTPYRTPDSMYSPTAVGVAVLLGLAKFFRKHSYWSKDIIFLITEHEQLGAQAWLEAYHQTSLAPGVLHSGHLKGRSGSIQAAINLEIPKERVSHFDVKIEGLNGQLPNLDLFNLVVRLCSVQGVQATFKNHYNTANLETYDGWQQSFKTMVAMMASQATGVPTGNHGLFHRFQIEALTLQGHTSLKDVKHASVISMMKILESIFHSLNNLLERFHQSFFFYLLPNTTRYVSIGLYMPPFALLLIGVAIKAVAIRIETNTLREEQSKNMLNDEQGDASKQLSYRKRQMDYSLTSAIPVLLVVHMLGISLYLSPQCSSWAGEILKLTSEESVFYGLLALYFSTLVAPMLLNASNASHVGQEQSWQVLKCVALLQLGTLLLCIAFLNFSLAFIVTAIYVPVCVTVTPSASKLQRWFKGLPVLAASPLVLLFLFITYDTTVMFPKLGQFKIMERTVMALRRTVLYGIMDGYIYGNWMFSVGCTLLFPIWLQFWNISQFKLGA